MVKTQLLFLAAIAFNYIPIAYSAATSRDETPSLAGINPTQALLYYSQRELEAFHRSIAANYSFFQKHVLENSEWADDISDKISPYASELYEHYTSVPSQDSSCEDYWRDFLNRALPIVLKSASEATKLPEKELLNNDIFFRNLAQGLIGPQNFIKILCIVKTIQRESRQNIEIEETVTCQKIACKAFEAAVRNQDATLKLVEENEELELVWKNFRVPTNKRLRQILYSKREEMRPSACLLL